jgi:hypothetical protein
MRPLGDAGSLLFGTLIRWSVLLEVRNKENTEFGFDLSATAGTRRQGKRQDPLKRDES